MKTILVIKTIHCKTHLSFYNKVFHCAIDLQNRKHLAHLHAWTWFSNQLSSILSGPIININIFTIWFEAV